MSKFISIMGWNFGLHDNGKDLYKGTAWYYSHYRQLYPSSFVRFLVDRLKAFHWMDRMNILDNLYDLVSNNGGIVIIDNYKVDKTLQPWEERVNEVVKKWFFRTGDVPDSGPYRISVFILNKK
jgi:hypothetical protein